MDANYILLSKKRILTQTPISATANRYLRMVWKTHANVIVSFGGEYVWPQVGYNTFGNIKIARIVKEQVGGVTVRDLIFTCDNKVRQLLYLECSANEDDPEIFLQLFRLMSGFEGKNTIIQCKNGRDMSAMFALYAYYADTGFSNIDKALRRLRMQRFCALPSIYHYELLKKIMRETNPF
jgi:hypothetical protein